MKIRLHHVAQSRSMRTLWLLHELGLEFERVDHPFDKSLRQPEYLALSPAGRVPAIEIDGLVMFETGAIAQYLCEIASPEGLGRPAQHPERADWLIWTHFAETISQHAAALTQQHLMLYDDAMRSPIVMKLEAARLGKCYDALEVRLSDGRAHLLETDFTAADVAVGQAVYMARHFRQIEHHPNLAAWYERLCARPAFEQCVPTSGERLYMQDFYPVWDSA